ncbi:hypothetical protein DL96DRAFT_1550271 [Flagelloscypha sp. PMI_526]|nr:hypothetical protein DL96DRAFT_1550271 [Flagelloscypha sp. PMI_526]
MHTSRPTTLTLLITFALALLLVAPNVEANQNAAHHRILRKRAPQTDADSKSLQPLIGAGIGGGNTDTATTTTGLPTTTTSSTSTTTTGGTGILDGITGLLPGTTSNSTTSTSTTSSSSTTSSIPTTLSTTSESSSTETSITAAPSTSVVRNIATVTATSSEAAFTTASAESQNTAKNSSIAVTVLIGVGASIGGIVIIWILYRGYQRARADKVDSRMQPIDFTPTGYDDEGLPGQHRRHSGASFNSYSHHGHQAGSDHGHSVAPLPEHDFTAGNSNLAPVGGYADLARGSSPQPPQMHEMGHGVSHNAYSTQVPLHHQGGGYDQGVTPLNFKY